MGTVFPIVATSPSSLHPSSIASSDNRRSFLGDLSALPSPSYSALGARGSFSSQKSTSSSHLRSPSPSPPPIPLSQLPLRSAQSLTPVSLSPSVYSLPQSPYLRRSPILASSTPDLPTQVNPARLPSSPASFPPSPNEERSSSSRSTSDYGSLLPLSSSPEPSRLLTSTGTTPPTFFDLDPTLPITNTLPPLPRSASASIKHFFSRSPKHHRYHEQPTPPSLFASPQPLLTSSKSTKGLIQIPSTAFSATNDDETGKRGGGGRGVEAWRKQLDPGVSRLEGMLSIHLELEKERMKRIGLGTADSGREV